MATSVRTITEVLDPKVAMTAMAMRKAGSTMIDSVTRMRTSSTAPRARPAVTPTSVARTGARTSGAAAGSGTGTAMAVQVVFQKRSQKVTRTGVQVTFWSAVELNVVGTVTPKNRNGASASSRRSIC